MPIILNISASVRFSSWQCQWPYPSVFNLILFQSLLWKADEIISGWKRFKVLLQWVCSHYQLHPHLALPPSSAPTMLRTMVPSIVFGPSLLLPAASFTWDGFLPLVHAHCPEDWLRVTSFRNPSLEVGLWSPPQDCHKNQCVATLF